VVALRMKKTGRTQFLMATAEEIKSLVSQVVDPELGRSLGDLRQIRDVKCDESSVTVDIELLTPAYPHPDRLKTEIEEQLAGAVGEGQTLNVALHPTVRGKNSGGRIGLNVGNVIAVGSGKGGVGKSTVAAALACGLKSLGCRVGLMDADVYGPSIPHMLGAKGQPAAKELQGPDGQKVVRIEPIDVNGLKLMSMGFFMEDGQSVVWRGPMLHKALTQFLKDTDWGELDYLVIDLPPGTGDVSLTLSQLIGLAGAVIVCTPQQVALLDAIKAVDMYQKVNVPVLGFVENMTGEIFGQGGAHKVADELKVPFLGEIPIQACIRELCDSGQIFKLLEDDCPARESLEAVSRNIAMQVARNLIDIPAAPTLEIL
jgi:ATP-binding protein involved in chromosome partitioning